MLKFSRDTSVHISSFTLLREGARIRRIYVFCLLIDLIKSYTCFTFSLETQTLSDKCSHKNRPRFVTGPNPLRVSSVEDERECNVSGIYFSLSNCPSVWVYRVSVEDPHYFKRTTI